MNAPDPPPEHPEPDVPPWLRWGVAMLLLIVGIAFWIVTAFARDVWHSNIDLYKEGWALVAVGLFVMFGIRLGDFVARRNGK